MDFRFFSTWFPLVTCKYLLVKKNLQVSSRDLVKKKLFILHYETTKILEHDNIHSRAACDNKISSTATAIPPQTINQDEFNVSLFIYFNP